MSFKPQYGTLYYDVNGHLILKIDDVHYFLSITNANELEWIEIHNMDKLLTITKPRQQSIKNTHDQYSLRGKVIDEIDKEHESNEAEIFFDDNEETQDYKEKYKFNPEYKYYHILDENLEEDSDDEYIYSNYGNTEIIECFDKALKFPSLYDLLFFDSANKLMLKTIEAKESNSYKVIVMKNGEIELSVIGDNRKKYSLDFIKENDMFIPQLNKTSTYMNK